MQTLNNSKGCEERAKEINSRLGLASIAIRSLFPATPKKSIEEAIQDLQTRQDMLVKTMVGNNGRTSSS